MVSDWEKDPRGFTATMGKWKSKKGIAKYAHP